MEDTAPAVGAEYKGRKVGTLGDVGCFSFQGAKMTVSGEGGILVANDQGIYVDCRLNKETRKDNKTQAINSVFLTIFIAPSIM
ncbi:MAG: DegT/DnrJ/EryC1/StrS family aminotransferase [Desulfosporosinus sp.]